MAKISGSTVPALKQGALYVLAWSVIAKWFMDQNSMKISATAAF